MDKSNKSVALLAAELAGDPEAAVRIKGHQSETHVVRELINMRVAKKCTQKELAKKMGVGPSKLCRMESSADRDLNLGDILLYVKALGLNMSVLFDDPALPAADRIKHHVFAIHSLLEQLMKLAHQVGGEDTLSDKIKQFYGEVLFNFTLGFGDSFSKLPGGSPIRLNSIEAPSKMATPAKRKYARSAIK